MHNFQIDCNYHSSWAL